MVAAANKALSATADGNQKKPVFPGFIPLGATPQQAAAALAARPAPNVLAGTGLGMGDPMNKMPPLAPAVGGELAPAFGSGLYGPNARYNALPQDNSQNVGAVAVPDKPIKPVQPGFIPERSAALDRSAAVAQPQAAPAAAPAPSLNAPWYSPEYARAAGMSDKGGLELERMRAANAPAGLPTNDPARRILTTGTASTGPSTAAAAPATPAAATALQNPLRVQEAKLGLSNPGTAPLAAPAGEPQRNASGALTNLGTGTDVGFGVTRYNIPGQSPLFTNKTGDSGAADNMALMNRGAPTAQNMAAMDALVNRSTAEGAQAVQRMQFNDQVAQAKAINAMPNPVDPRAAMDVTSPQYQAARLQNMEMRQKTGESLAAYQTRMQAMASGAAELGMRRDTLAANTKQADARLGIDQQRLGLDQQRLGLDGKRLANDQETGSLTRDQKRMEMDHANKIQALQDRYMTATGTEQEALGKQLLTMSGKDPKSSMKENFMVVGGGQEWDAQANSMRNVPQTLIDLRTGKPVGGGATQTKPAGKQAAPVKYQDANGNKAYWDGTKYVPV